MNIFWLDKDVQRCASYHCDEHAVKMVVEYAQLLSTAVRLTHGDARGLLSGERLTRVGERQYAKPIIGARAYAVTHANHPCAVWARISIDNWLLLRRLALALADEYTRRWGRIHASARIITALPVPRLPRGLTTPPLTMPERYVGGGVVSSYRRFYREGKPFATWKYTPRPLWMQSCGNS